MEGPKLSVISGKRTSERVSGLGISLVDRKKGKLTGDERIRGGNKMAAADSQPRQAL